jgi:hypothetical protein
MGLVNDFVIFLGEKEMNTFTISCSERNQVWMFTLNANPYELSLAAAVFGTTYTIKVNEPIKIGNCYYPRFTVLGDYLILVRPYNNDQVAEGDNGLIIKNSTIWDVHFAYHNDTGATNIELFRQKVRYHEQHHYQTFQWGHTAIVIGLSQAESKQFKTRNAAINYSNTVMASAMQFSINEIIPHSAKYDNNASWRTASFNPPLTNAFNQNFIPPSP